MTDARELLLEEVKFKWLMSGLDIWIDMSKFRSDPQYATHFLAIGAAAKCTALKSCAIELQRRRAVKFAGRNHAEKDDPVVVSA